MKLLTLLFGKSDASSEMLCPHCERSMGPKHNVDACARKRMSRRFFFQTLGGAAAAVAIAKALPQVPAPAPTPEEVGISIRFVRTYDSRLANPLITRFDVLYGFSAIRPEMACYIDINSGDDNTYEDEDDECFEPEPLGLIAPSLYPPMGCQVTL